MGGAGFALISRTVPSGRRKALPAEGSSDDSDGGVVFSGRSLPCLNKEGFVFPITARNDGFPVLGEEAIESLFDVYAV